MEQTLLRLSKYRPNALRLTPCDNPRKSPMHEMALCEEILLILERQAKAQNYRRVKTVRLEIGALAGVEAEALRFCFGAVVHNSLAEGAVLEIIDVPGSAWCLSCMQTVPVAQRYDACPQCGSYRLQVNGGEQMRIRELEVE